MSEPSHHEARKRNVLGVMVTAVEPLDATAAVLAAARDRRPLSVTATAVHGLMTAVEDSEHRYRLNHFDLVLPDGQPIRWALNLLHRCGLRERVAGPDLTWRLCRAAAAEGLPVYFYGSTSETLLKLTAQLGARLPNLRIAGAVPSRFRRQTEEEVEAAAAAIRDSGAALVFVGLGCPRQEVWAFENRDRVGLPVIAVGAAFDFHAGTIPRAPAILGRLGLEWLFRLAHEPRRLWRRYLRLNPRFLALLAQQLAGLRRFDPAGPSAPRTAERYG
ncbi:MAG: WecB/TagA/CpsF family glycosyltransferase [Gemmatimonadales bacterium]